MGLMSLLFGTAALGSAVKCGIENAECKRDIQHLPDGTPYYYDRLGRRYLLNGTQIFGGGGDTVTDKNGRVIWSRTQQWNKEAAAEVPAGPYRYCTQYNDRSVNPVTTNLDTGEMIGQIERKISGGKTVCRKWKWYDASWAPGKNMSGLCKTVPNATKVGDPGIVITEEEFEAIKHCHCVRNGIPYHSCWDDEDYYRTHRR